MSLRNPLGRVLGSGAAGHGVQHWWVQRLSAIALVPLSIWLLAALLSLPALDHATVSRWLAGYWSALLMMLLVLTASWHSHLGLRVIIEDYVHGAGMKTLALTLSSCAHAVLVAAGVLAVLKIALGAAP